MAFSIRSFFSTQRTFTKQIKTLTGITPANTALFELALRHSSVSGEEKQSNERLEYLGDSVMSLIVAEYLYKKFPFKNEGYLTELRSKMVSRSQMSNVALKMGLDQMLEYNKADVYLSKNSISGNALEALIGAVYLDKGIDGARKFILQKIIQPFLDIDEIEISEFNYKSKLLEWGQKNSMPIHFKLVEEKKVNRNTLFKVIVLVNRQEYGSGEDFNKKNAEKKASKEAYTKLQQNEYKLEPPAVK